MSVAPALAGAGALAGLVLRLWILSSSIGGVDSDEAVVGLMVRHYPRDLSVFYDGQTYGGTLEPILSAPFVQIVGGSVGLKLVPLLLSAVAAVLTWRVALRLVRPLAATTAGILVWVFPPAFLFWSTKARGFYWMGLCLALGVLLVALRLGDGVEPRRDLMVGGFLVGLAWWTTPQSLLLIAPAGVWLVVRHSRLLRYAYLALPGLFLGALPWIAYNVRYGLVSLDEGDRGVHLAYPDRVEGFFTHLLPQLLGLRMPYSGDWVLGRLGIVLTVALVVVGGLYLWRRRRALEPIIYVAVSYPLLFAIPETSFHVGEPRYGLWFMPVVAIVAAGVSVEGLRREANTQATERAAALRASGLLVVAVLLSTLGIAHLIDHGEKNLGNYDLNPSDLDATLAELAELDRDLVWADYWLAHRLEYESDGDIRAAAVTGPLRRAASRTAVEGAPSTTFVLFAGSGPDERLPAALAELSVPFERIAVDDLVVVYALEPAVSPGDLAGVW